MPIRPTVVLYALALVLAITPRMRADIQRQDFFISGGAGRRQRAPEMSCLFMAVARAAFRLSICRCATIRLPRISLGAASWFS